MKKHIKIEQKKKENQKELERLLFQEKLGEEANIVAYCDKYPECVY